MASPGSRIKSILIPSLFSGALSTSDQALAVAAGPYRGRAQAPAVCPRAGRHRCGAARRCLDVRSRPSRRRRPAALARLQRASPRGLSTPTRSRSAASCCSGAASPTSSGAAAVHVGPGAVRDRLVRRRLRAVRAVPVDRARGAGTRRGARCPTALSIMTTTFPEGRRATGLSACGPAWPAPAARSACSWAAS